LIVLSGPNTSETHDVPEKGDLIIGRDEAAQLHIVEEGMSRRHARIFVKDGETYVEDLGSRNGVFVAGERVHVHRLSPGDILQLGATSSLKFTIAADIELEYERKLVDAAHRDP